MCGLAGWAWKNPPKKNVRRTLCNALGVFNDSRGGKGYGVFDAVRQIVRKGPETMSWFIGTSGLSWAHCMRGFLHTRMPSVGDVKAENAHPFTIGPVTGAHNGTLSNHSELNTKYGRTFEVDSMHIFAHLAEGRSLEDIHGSGVIEWFDARDQRLRLMYFNSNNLDVCRFKDKGQTFGVAWSSAKYHLEDAVKRAGLYGPLEWVRTEERQAYDVTSGEIYDCPVYGKVAVGSYYRTTTPTVWAGGHSNYLYDSGDYGSYRGRGGRHFGFVPNTTTSSSSTVDDNPVILKTCRVEWKDGTEGTRTTITLKDGHKYSYWDAKPNNEPAAVALHDVTTKNIRPEVKQYLSAGDYRDEDGEATCGICHATYRVCQCKGADGHYLHTSPFPPAVQVDPVVLHVPEQVHIEAAENAADTSEASRANQPGQESIDETPDFVPDVSAIEKKFLDPVLDTVLECYDDDEVDRVVGEVAALVAGLDAKSRYFPLADSGFFDHMSNPVPWWQVDCHNHLWNKSSRKWGTEIIMAWFNERASQEEGEALNLIRYILFGEEGVLDDDPDDLDTPLELEIDDGPIPTPRSVTDVPVAAPIEALPVPQAPRSPINEAFDALARRNV